MGTDDSIVMTPEHVARPRSNRKEERVDLSMCVSPRLKGCMTTLAIEAACLANRQPAGARGRPSIRWFDVLEGNSFPLTMKLGEGIVRAGMAVSLNFPYVHDRRRSRSPGLASVPLRVAGSRDYDLRRWRHEERCLRVIRITQGADAGEHARERQCFSVFLHRDIRSPGEAHIKGNSNNPLSYRMTGARPCDRLSQVRVTGTAQQAQAQRGRVLITKAG